MATWTEFVAPLIRIATKNSFDQNKGAPDDAYWKIAQMSQYAGELDLLEDGTIKFHSRLELLNHIANLAERLIDLNLIR